MNENNNELTSSDGTADVSTDENVDLALTYFENEQYEKAAEMFHSLMDVSIVAKYYVSILLYDGIGTSENHAKEPYYSKTIIMQEYHAVNPQ